MLRTIATLLMVFATLRVSAQWEMIGPDGSPDDMVRVGSDLYGITKYGFYRSSDDGATWEKIEKGLPRPINHTFELNYDGYEFYLPASTFHTSAASTGFYVLGEDDQWHYLDSTYSKLYNLRSRRISRDSCISLFPKAAYPYIASLHLSTDGGATWVLRSPPFNLSLDYLFYSGKRIFLRSSARIYRSDDFGLSWQVLNHPFNPDGLRQLVGPFHGVLFAEGWVNTKLSCARSTDNGNTWQLIDSLKGNSYLREMKTIGNQLFAIFEIATFRSTDGGVHWETIATPPNEFILRLVGTTPGNGYLALMAALPGQTPKFYTVDNAFTFLPGPKNAGFITTAFPLLYVGDSVLVAKYGSSLDSISVSTNRGISWELRPLTGMRLYYSSGPWMKGASYIYAVDRGESHDYSLFRSSDEGITWQECPHQPAPSHPYIMAITNDTLVVDYGVTQQGFWRSNDGGDTWSLIQIPNDFGVLDLCFLNGYLYELDSSPESELFRSSNGVIWERFELPQGKGFWFNNIASADGILYLSALRYPEPTSKHLFRSADEGRTWTEITDLLGELTPRTHIVENGATTYLLSENSPGFIHTDGYPRIFASTDKGETWEQINTNIPEATSLFVTGSDVIVSAWPNGGNYRLHKEPGTVDSRQNDRGQQLTLYPNPATQQLSVVHPPGAYTYTIVSMAGMSLLSQISEMSDHAELDVSALPAGIYCLRVHNEQISMQTRFVVVR